MNDRMDGTTGPGADGAVDPRTARLHQTLVGAGVLAVGAVLAWGATAIPSAAGYAGVGPNFLPWVVAIALIACGALLVAQAHSGGFRQLPVASGAPRADWVSAAWVLGGLAANALLLTRIGFILSCTLCFMLAVRGLRRAEGRSGGGAMRLVLDFATGFLIAAPAYWLFGKLLAINLPGLTGTGWL